MAGGLAKRMHPHTLTVPKAMLPVVGRPFVDWQLELLAQSGVRDVVMCVAHLGEQIRDHVGDGARFGARVTWSEEGPALLGTAGAIRAALPLLAETFLVTYGDSYLPFDYSGPIALLDRSPDADGVMAVFKNQGKWDTSNVITDGDWIRRYEKGAGATDPRFDHIDYGATALRRSIIAALPEGETAALDAIQRDLAARGRLRAYGARERFYEVGSPDGLTELEAYLKEKVSS